MWFCCHPSHICRKQGKGIRTWACLLYGAEQKTWVDLGTINLYIYIKCEMGDAPELQDEVVVVVEHYDVVFVMRWVDNFSRRI